MRYLTFALGKGRLAKTTLEMFEKIGITCEGRISLAVLHGNGLSLVSVVTCHVALAHKQEYTQGGSGDGDR